MFTGIVETVGTVSDLQKRKGNLLLTVESAISSALQVDQSVSHNGACLTIVQVGNNTHQVEAIEETLSKTNLNTLKLKDPVNLERALLLNNRLDGHLVQGHVDVVGRCEKRADKEGSRLFTFTFPEKFAPLIIEKGSIAVNGVSLTAFDVTKNGFTIAVIPYTLNHTMLGSLAVGEQVNLEFDLIGKYVLRSREVS